MRRKGSIIASEIIKDWNREEYYKKLAKHIKRLNNRKVEQNTKK